MKQKAKYTIGILVVMIIVSTQVFASVQPLDDLRVVETPEAIEIHTSGRSSAGGQVQSGEGASADKTILPETYKFDPLKYTLGPDDAVEIIVLRHPEFSGAYPIDQEGKLQYKFVGDIDVNGLTKLQLEEKTKGILSAFVIAPEVNVTITQYRSKVIYVLGEVSTPGKYYMRSEAIPVREAVFLAGLPTQSAATRKCQIITPDKNGRARIRKVNLYSVLYGGNLKKNIEMKPGDVLYVPATVMAKVIRVINPVASTVGVASSGPSSASSGKTAVEALAR